MSMGAPTYRRDQGIARILEVKGKGTLRIDNDVCSSLKGKRQGHLCREAKGKENIAKADAEADYENTPEARQKARAAHAQANYNVAIEKCDDLVVSRKGVCVKEAKAELIKGKANANLDRVASDTGRDADGEAG